MQYDKEFIPQSPRFAWLLDHLDGWQFGEQGLVLAIADALKIQGHCVEVGAGDGESLPLTIERLYLSGRKCVLYEIDDDSRTMLGHKFTKASVRGEYRCDGEYGDLFVIDVDSNDSMMMRHVMQNVKPMVVACEHMDREYPVTSTAFSPLPMWAMGLPLEGGFKVQDTAETLHRYASEAGYERIGHNRCNSFFVRRDHYANLFR